MFRSHRLIQCFVVLFILQFFCATDLWGMLNNLKSLRQAVEQGNEEKYGDAINAAREGIASDKYEIQQEALDLFTALTKKTDQGDEEAAAAAARCVIDRYFPHIREKALRLFQALFAKETGYKGYKEAAEAVSKGMNNGEYKVRDAAIKLCKMLLEEEQYEDVASLASQAMVNYRTDEALDIFLDLVDKTDVGDEKAVVAAGRGILDPYKPRSKKALELLQKLFVKGKGHNEVEKIVVEHLTNKDHQVRTQAYDTMDLLKKNPQTIGVAVKAAIQAAKNEDSAISLRATFFLPDLFELGQGEKETIAAARELVDNNKIDQAQRICGRLIRKDRDLRAYQDDIISIMRKVIAKKVDEDTLKILMVLVEKKVGYDIAAQAAEKAVAQGDYSGGTAGLKLILVLVDTTEEEDKRAAIVAERGFRSDRDLAIKIFEKLFKRGKGLEQAEAAAIQAITSNIHSVRNVGYDFMDLLIKKPKTIGVAVKAATQAVKNKDFNVWHRAAGFLPDLFREGQGEKEAIATAHELVDGKEIAQAQRICDFLVRWEKDFTPYLNDIISIMGKVVAIKVDKEALEILMSLVKKKLVTSKSGYDVVVQAARMGVKSREYKDREAALDLMNEVVEQTDVYYKAIASIAGVGIIDSFVREKALELFKKLLARKQGYQEGIAVLENGLATMNELRGQLYTLGQIEAINKYCNELFDIIKNSLKALFKGDSDEFKELNDSLTFLTSENINRIKQLAIKAGLIEEEKAPEPEEKEEDKPEEPSKEPAAAEPMTPTESEKKLAELLEKIGAGLKQDDPAIQEKATQALNKLTKEQFEKLYPEHKERLSKIFDLDPKERVKALQEFIAHPEKRNVVEAESDADALIKSLATLKTKLVQLSSMLSEV